MDGRKDQTSAKVNLKGDRVFSGWLWQLENEMKCEHRVTRGGLDQPQKVPQLYANRGFKHIPARIISGLVMMNQTSRWIQGFV